MDALESYLHDDVRNNIATCEKLINIANKILQGDIEQWEGGSVSYSVKLNLSGAYVEEIYMMPILKGRYSIGQFIKIIDEHRQSINK